MAAPIPDCFIPPPPSPSYAPTSTPPWHPPPPPPTPCSEQCRFIGFLVFAFAMSIVGLILWGAPRENHDRAEAAAAAAAPPPRALRWPRPTRNFEEQLRRLRQARAANPVARLPAFKYNRSVNHNVTAGVEECSVCLGTFQLGETVRLLPLCLHLYHVECIDPWLDAHSTCPTCRSDTRPTMDVLRLPPV